MISHFFLSLLAFWIAFLPVYLWGYGVSYLLDTPWNRRRFFLGMMIWWLSICIVWIFSYLGTRSPYGLVALSIFFIILIASLFILIRSGSVYARALLQKFATINMLSIFILLTATITLSTFLPGWALLALSIAPLLISSLIEESSKHLMSIWLMSQNFAFSRRDIIIFTLFVVLGFVFIENLLYLAVSYTSLSTWIFRSFFSLLAHLLASVICAYAWWRALSYEPYSLRYISIFVIWFIIATLTHLCYNLILAEGSMIGLFVYMIIWYIVVTQGILNTNTIEISEKLRTSSL